MGNNGAAKKLSSNQIAYLAALESGTLNKTYYATRKALISRGLVWIDYDCGKGFGKVKLTEAGYVALHSLR